MASRADGWPWEGAVVAPDRRLQAGQDFLALHHMDDVVVVGVSVGGGRAQDRGDPEVLLERSWLLGGRQSAERGSAARSANWEGEPGRDAKAKPQRLAARDLTSHRPSDSPRN